MKTYSIATAIILLVAQCAIAQDEGFEITDSSGRTYKKCVVRCMQINSCSTTWLDVEHPVQCTFGCSEA